MTTANHYCVTAVRYQNQQLTAVQLGHGDGSGAWQQEPHAVTVDQVVARIDAGDQVHALLRDGTQVTLGPRLKVLEGGGSGRSLALDNSPSDCLELADLERF
ncbi:hypothetical protein LJR039_003974 [Pseudorhodoferax sp. LjRoot39]|uniref:hypothetical protein n=1 Tax=Pseudorhodoferax sp. LjRoot39 TaxID=3342328 RepID=UPI003ECFC240